MEVNRIYNESCLETLARMSDAFLDCVVTSPPYYGLRSYGTEPQVWGNHNGCDHAFGKEMVVQKRGSLSPHTSTLEGGKDTQQHQGVAQNQGQFCQSCNAWRGEIGLEPTFQLYISHLIDIFREIRRALKPTGTVWVNLGDSYAGSWGAMSHTLAGKGQKTGYIERPNTSRPQGIREKSVMNIPARFAIAMTDELQFIQRNNIIWHKPACMPSSAKDRFTVDFENIFFFTKESKYWFEQQLEGSTGNEYDRNRPAFRMQGTKSLVDGVGQKIAGVSLGVGAEHRNMRTTWTIPFEPSSNEHYAAYPTKLVDRMVRAGCPPDGIVYDPFGGTATTAVTAHKLGRNWICSELQPKYAAIAERRMARRY